LKSHVLVRLSAAHPAHQGSSFEEYDTPTLKTGLPVPVAAKARA
jgi:hypothetical protein